MEAVKPSFWDKLSVEQIKIELMRTAYGHANTFLSRFDPRVLVIWYAFFAIAPWFIFNKTVLLGMLALMVVLTYTSRVSTLVLVILAVGLVSDVGYMLFVSFFFGGSLDAIWSLSTLTLKLLVISLASIAVFASMDPEKFSDAMLSLGMPAQFSFGISYGYRMLPILIEEYNNLIYSYRLRGRTPRNKGLLKWRYLVYMGKITVIAFYPLILNTAKRTRTTVEALEVKGFTYAMTSSQAKKLKLAYLRIERHDYLFIAVSVLFVAALFTLGRIFPL
ncbi:energy-coupling factor transport system permease protein [Paenibacillus phyllosphaerae]|uniref:Energy-coupling factor transport system permease protein n=1 Tax=Paenibacillus phyllosphaerae TaxID=274593 RepID=A0A7W5FP38_9BACL|nr:energy-coupling factor transporter transmembrane component T [Paenibacillus phyllosphaerae]MBB3111807.1 energy-coupling factor transport system permease protein [Paenibacillus phyllosphaerae]